MDKHQTILDPDVGTPTILLNLNDTGDPMEVGNVTDCPIRQVNQVFTDDTNIIITCEMPGEQEYISINCHVYDLLERKKTEPVAGAFVQPVNENKQINTTKLKKIPACADGCDSCCPQFLLCRGAAHCSMGHPRSHKNVPASTAGFFRTHRKESLYPYQHLDKRTVLVLSNNPADIGYAISIF